MAQEEVGRNPTDRGEKGSKRHILVDEHGVPLSLVVTEANRHDVTQLGAVLDTRIVLPPKETKQNLCADEGIYRRSSPKDHRGPWLYSSCQKTW